MICPSAISASKLGVGVQVPGKFEMLTWRPAGCWLDGCAVTRVEVGPEGVMRAETTRTGCSSKGSSDVSTVGVVTTGVGVAPPDAWFGPLGVASWVAIASSADDGGGGAFPEVPQAKARGIATATDSARAWFTFMKP